MWSVIKKLSNAIITVVQTRCKVTAFDLYDKEARALMNGLLCADMKSTALLPTPRRGRSGVPAARRKARKQRNKRNKP